jgi:hypothetical protein
MKFFYLLLFESLPLRQLDIRLAVSLHAELSVKTGIGIGIMSQGILNVP